MNVDCFIRDLAKKHAIESSLKELLFHRHFEVSKDLRGSIESEVSNRLGKNVKIRNVWEHKNQYKKTMFVQVDEEYDLKLEIIESTSFDDSSTIVSILDLICTTVHDKE